MENSVIRISILWGKVLVAADIWKKFLFHSNFPFTKKLEYAFHSTLSLMLRRGFVVISGNRFSFDNRFQPVLLPVHLLEISEIINSADAGNIDRVMDVGANVGQFARALIEFNKDASIVSFEPNPTIFGLLHSNSAQFDNWQVFNVGFAEESTERKLHYVESKSGQGSIYKENARLNLSPDAVVSFVTVELVKPSAQWLRERHIPIEYDLLKIDVEGYESKLLPGLADISFRFLYVEIGMNRVGTASLEAFIELCENTWNAQFRVVFANYSDELCEVLLKREHG